MTGEHFNKAVEIISSYHSSIVKINTPKNGFVGNLGDTEFRLHITQCVPAVVDKLVNAGYMLSMTGDGLLVDRMGSI